MIQALATVLHRSAATRTRLLTALMLLFSLQIPAANAAMVSTESLLAAQADRAKVAAFLQRDQVRQAFVDQGLDPQTALARVDRLTDGEVALLADKIDEMPAGGDIIGAALLVFFVLLATDILGYTHVFPFVNR